MPFNVLCSFWHAQQGETVYKCMLALNATNALQFGHAQHFEHELHEEHEHSEDKEEHH